MSDTTRLWWSKSHCTCGDQNPHLLCTTYQSYSKHSCVRTWEEGIPLNGQLTTWPLLVRVDLKTHMYARPITNYVQYGRMYVHWKFKKHRHFRIGRMPWVSNIASVLTFDLKYYHSNKHNLYSALKVPLCVSVLRACYGKVHMHATCAINCSNKSKEVTREELIFWSRDALMVFMFATDFSCL
jgi:hypothetical protein